ncbi:MAG: heat-inducible transcriptional repressor HrcA [Candidatus Omnitrophica bacterium]|nr:heat-inducible transcriptional repressor HrcA [Candidatus Omnitrophota bacterium]
MPLKDIMERQNKVLEIIISSYVGTALPVGSRSVSKVIGFSSATIRNIMSDLEEQGYITHPHTSAGRIPTDKGYRCYVGSLMRLKNIKTEEARRIDEEYRLKRKNIEDIIKKTTEILAGITHQTGIVLFPKFKRSVFKRINLVSIGRKKVLVVLVASTGIVRHFIIDTKDDLDREVEAITNLLNSEYYGLTIDGIKGKLLRRLKEERDSSRSLIEEASDIIDSMLQLFQEDELYLGGTSCLLSQPEFESANSVKSMLRIFEDKSALSRLMEEDLEKEGITVYIGKENKNKDMQNCSIVTSSYRFKDEFIGRLGIIGPTRMEYSHLIPAVNYISEIVTRTLNEFME